MSNLMNSGRSTKLSWKNIALFLILVSAFGIRLIGIDFGLPYLYHPDEPKTIQIAQNIFTTGDLNPHYYSYPSLFIYLNALAYIPYYFYGTIKGEFSTPNDIPGITVLTMGVGEADQSSVVLLGRLLTVTFSVLSMFLVYLIGVEVSSKKRIGILSALFLALSPVSVSTSRYITPDAFVTFWILFTTLFCIRINQNGEIRDYLLAGIGCGLTISTKYNGVVIGIVILLAHFLRYDFREWKNHLFDRPLFLAVLMIPVSFLLTTPYAVLDVKNWFGGLSFEFTHYSAGHAGMEGNSLVWYLTFLKSSEGMVVILGFLYMIINIRNFKSNYFPLIGFTFIYLFIVSLFQVRNDRTILPIVPFLCVFSGALCSDLYEGMITKNRYSPILKNVTFILILMTVSYSLFQNTQVARKLVYPDGREVSANWIEQNLPSGSKIAIEAYSPYIDPSKYQIVPMTRIIDQPIEWYSNQGVKYLVFSQGMFQRYYDAPFLYKEEKTKYDGFFTSLPLIYETDANDYLIRIYSLSEDNSLSLESRNK